ncbi:GNAT family N-acetyltransferase [Nocardiopsis sp. CT-R113]|uniref:GNAT family N-acetyltransferase n=1 Tax=Nocardiopsis codii TaxID=3065942 RepID=A0ABU7K5U9_9ACTN|nr:GNAT family N-acetyltransferase [Nocardiopsis sp. CT-R113]MEE2037621.1 GNAT family N-acetyltransferase [Nocardiopsis sp. CT-R113]
MKVTTTTLDMLSAPEEAPRAFPDDVRLDRAPAVSPEYARFLYGLVGGPWHWTERLGWSRERWVEELAVRGTEFWILYGGGLPLGYLHLQPTRQEEGTHVEIRYFGLAEQAIGRGLGGRLLEHGIRAAWSLPERFDLADVTRVWVHTCTLDGPAALANYQDRGLRICRVEETDEPVADRPLGSWASTGGPTGAP